MANYRGYARRVARQNGIPVRLFMSLISHESGWNPNAVSPAGAIGLGQLMPGTAQGLGVNPHNPRQNLRGAAKYLRSQYDSFGSWRLALAGYNAGGGAVKQYGGIPPFPETEAYVRNVLADAGGVKGLGGAGPRSSGGSSGASGGMSTEDFALGNLSAIAAGDYDPIAALDELVQIARSGGGSEPSAFVGKLGKIKPGKVDPRLIELAKQYGLSIGSGFRTPEQNAATNGAPGSYHLQGRAIDVSPGSGLMKLARYVRKHPGQFTEFFYDPLGWYVKNGRIVRGAIGGHGDHGHIVLS
jgi:hypothetical protein